MAIILNFFLYDVFKNVIISSYLLRMLLGICSYAINAIGVIMVLEADFVRVPLEGFLQLIAETKTGFPITIREGTIMNAIVFGTVLDLMKEPIDKIYKRYKVA